MLINILENYETSRINVLNFIIIYSYQMDVIVKVRYACTTPIYLLITYISICLIAVSVSWKPNPLNLTHL